jgi:ferredoxin-NADP reductase
VAYAYTRSAPPGWTGPVGRITPRTLAAPGFDRRQRPAVFACGPTGFVEAAASILTAAGHAEGRIKTERFG